MRTVKSIQAADTFLRKLAGQPSTIDIRTAYHTTVLSRGNVITVSTTRIIVTTEDKIEVDTTPRPTLQEAFNAAAQAVTRARVQLASKRNARAIQQLAAYRSEVHR